MLKLNVPLVLMRGEQFMKTVVVLALALNVSRRNGVTGAFMSLWSWIGLRGTPKPMLC
jgi:hypothetical protein